MTKTSGLVTQQASGIVVAGHGVASGQARDTPFGAGTIALQHPHFVAAGVPLEGLHPATVNLDLAPLTLVLQRPRWRVADLTWTAVHGPETFSFVEVDVEHEGRVHHGLVYHPHPETKPMHHQAPTVVELLLPHLPGLHAGARLGLDLAPGQAHLAAPGDAPAPRSTL